MDGIDHFSALPYELIKQIMGNLTPFEAKPIGTCCKLFQKAVKESQESQADTWENQFGGFSLENKEVKLNVFSETTSIVRKYFPKSDNEPEVIEITPYNTALKFDVCLSDAAKALLSKNIDFFPMTELYRFFNEHKDEILHAKIFEIALDKLKSGKGSIDKESCILPMAVKAKLPLSVIKTLVEVYHAPINVALPPVFGFKDESFNMCILEWCICEGATPEIIEYLLENGGRFGEVVPELLSEAIITLEMSDFLLSKGFNVPPRAPQEISTEFLLALYEASL